MQASGKLADPDLLVTASSGRIEAAGHVLESLAIDARIATPASAPRGTATLDGKLDGMPLALAFRGQPDGSAVQVEQGEARLGPARLAVTGRLDPAGPTFDGTAKLEATDLAPLGKLGGVAGLAGRLVLDAKLTAEGWPAGLRGQARRAEARLQRHRGQPAGDRRRHPGRDRLDRPGPRHRGQRQRPRQGGAGQRRLAARPRGAGGAGDGRGGTAGRSDPGQARRAMAGSTWRRPHSPSPAAAGSRRAANGARSGPTSPPPSPPCPWRWPSASPPTSSRRARSRPISAPPARSAKPEIKRHAERHRPRRRAPIGRSGLPALTLRAEGSLAGEAAQLRADLDAGPAGRIDLTARLPNGFGPQGTASRHGRWRAEPGAARQPLPRRRRRPGDRAARPGAAGGWHGRHPAPRRPRHAVGRRVPQHRLWRAGLRPERHRHRRRHPAGDRPYRRPHRRQRHHRPAGQPRRRAPRASRPT